MNYEKNDILIITHREEELILCKYNLHNIKLFLVQFLVGIKNDNIGYNPSWLAANSYKDGMIVFHKNSIEIKKPSKIEILNFIFENENLTNKLIYSREK